MPHLSKQNIQQCLYTMQFLGADLSLTTNRRESAFYLATYNRICNPESTDMSCLYVLYYAGADKDLPNANGFTPLQLAAVFGHTSLARWLLARGCSTTVFPKPALLARSQGNLNRDLS